MIAMMYDGLELGKFQEESDGTLKLKLNKNVKKSWLPYIFEEHLDKDMKTVIKAWKKERVFPKDRFGSKAMLKQIGLKKYDLDKIAEITRCSVITDPYWIAYDETDRFETHSIRGKLKSDKYPYNSMKLPNEEDYIWRI